MPTDYPLQFTVQEHAIEKGVSTPVESDLFLIRNIKRTKGRQSKICKIWSR